MEHLTHFSYIWSSRRGIPGLFLVMLLGNVGIPVGTELMVPAAGAFAGAGKVFTSVGALPGVWAVAAVATAGEIVGAGVLYWIGFYGGRPFVERWGKYIALSPHKLDLAHAFYERHGRKTVFLSRFIPVIRGIASLPAGISRMPKRYFFPYTAGGSAIFCLGLALLGNAFGRHLDQITPYVHKASLVGIVLLAAAVIGFVLVNMKKKQPD